MTRIARTRPLVAVVFRVPLFVEALTAAFDGIADVQGLRATDGALDGLLHALRPDAVVVESESPPSYEIDVPVVHVDLEAQVVERRVDGEWRREDVDLSGEAIRNVVLSTMFAVVEA